jgi:mono/diheme cytochrome c family protein
MKLGTAIARTACAAAFAASASVSALTIELPKETAQLKDAPGVDLATRRCATCHSFDYVAIQPPGKPLAFWKAEVEKMKKVYGASIPDDEIEPIAQYLTRAYGDGKVQPAATSAAR